MKTTEEWLNVIDGVCSDKSIESIKVTPDTFKNALWLWSGFVGIDFHEKSLKEIQEYIYGFVTLGITLRKEIEND